MEKRSKNLIYFTLILIIASWGLNVIAIKMIVSAFLPLTITAFRLLVAGIFVFLVLACVKKVRLPSKTEFWFILAGGLFNIVGHHYFLSFGLLQTSASNAGLILGLGPILTTVLAALLLRSSTSLAQIIGVVIGFTGVAVVVLNNGSISSISIGDLFIFLSILLQAVSFIIISKISATFDPRLMTGYMLIFGAIALFIISLITEPNGINSLMGGSLEIWIIFFASSILVTALGQMGYNYAIGQIGPAKTSIFINLQPFFSLIGAVIFLDENVDIGHIFGFLFIITGVIIGSDLWEEIIKTIQKKKRSHI